MHDPRRIVSRGHRAVADMDGQDMWGRPLGVAVVQREGEQWSASGTATSGASDQVAVDPTATGGEGGSTGRGGDSGGSHFWADKGWVAGRERAIRKMRKEPCFTFQKTGSCARGDSCRFNHDL